MVEKTKSKIPCTRQAFGRFSGSSAAKRGQRRGHADRADRRRECDLREICTLFYPREGERDSEGERKIELELI